MTNELNPAPSRPQVTVSRSCSHSSRELPLLIACVRGRARRARTPKYGTKCVPYQFITLQVFQLPNTEQSRILRAGWQPQSRCALAKQLTTILRMWEVLVWVVFTCALHIVTSTSPCSSLFEYETHVTKISHKITHMNQSHNGCTVYITLRVKLSKVIECHACKHYFLDQLFFSLNVRMTLKRFWVWFSAL